MRDKILFGLTISTLIIAISTIIPNLYSTDTGNLISNISINCSLFSGAYLLIFNGTLQKKTYWALTWSLIVLTFLDSMCRMEHILIGDEIFILSLLLFPLGYTIRFIKKKEQLLLDWLKMLSVNCIFISKVLIEMTPLNGDYILIGNVILVITCIVFWKNNSRKIEVIEFDFLKESNPHENEQEGIPADK